MKLHALMIIGWLLIGSTSALAANLSCQNPVLRLTEQYRYLFSDGLPCQPGNFPHPNNPIAIKKQSYAFEMPLRPHYTGHPIPTDNFWFGVGSDGIPFDASTARWWHDNKNSGWNYDAMTGYLRLGLDQNHAHVSANGAYHYHGLPTSLIQQLSHGQNKLLLLGYAADGFPIYGATGLTAGNHAILSSYRLKSGFRPRSPGGKFDGRFVSDFQYQKGSGSLDQCNGQFGKTSEYPNGTYYYHLTNHFPFVPRCFMGTPDKSFLKHKQKRRQRIKAHAFDYRSGTTIFGSNTSYFDPLDQSFQNRVNTTKMRIERAGKFSDSDNTIYRQYKRHAIHQSSHIRPREFNR